MASRVGSIVLALFNWIFIPPDLERAIHEYDAGEQSKSIASESDRHGPA